MSYFNPFNDKNLRDLLGYQDELRRLGERYGSLDNLLPKSPVDDVAAAAQKRLRQRQRNLVRRA